MKILLGSTSEQKNKVLLSVIKDGQTVLIDAKSDITDQPIDEETTIRGSVNRARNAIKDYGGEDFDLSVGLEGGLSKINDLFYLICVASIIDKEGHVFTGVSKKLPLPKKVSVEIDSGRQFGELIRSYRDSLSEGSSSQTVSLIDELISRRDSFTEAIASAYFQRNNKTIFK